MSETVSIQARQDPKPPNRRKGAADGFVTKLAFLIPFLQFIQFRAIGLLSGSDILLVVVFICLLFSGKIRLDTPTAKRLIFFCFLWLASQIVTDFVRHSAFADYSRGWSNIGLTIVNFIVFFSLLYGHPRRLELYGWGLAVGSLLTFLIIPNDVMLEAPWKFGWTNPITWSVFLIVSRRSIPAPMVYFLSGSMGILNFVLGSRNMGGSCLLACFFLVLAGWLRKRSGGGKEIRVRFALLVFVPTVLLGLGMLFFYQLAAQRGIFGDEAREKAEIQASGAYGPLLGGRPTILGAAAAIYDSPILGHGSWAKDSLYAFLQARALQRLGYKEESESLRVETLRTGLIPAHSFILAAWVWAGVVGAFFWIWVFVVALRNLLRLLRINSTLRPFAVFGSIGLLWDILFSPYGSGMRIISPFFLVLLLSCAQLNQAIGVSRSNHLPKKAMRLAVRSKTGIRQGIATNPKLSDIA